MRIRNRAVAQKAPAAAVLSLLLSFLCNVPQKTSCFMGNIILLDPALTLYSMNFNAFEYRYREERKYWHLIRRLGVWRASQPETCKGA